MRAAIADMPEDSRFVFEVGPNEFVPICGGNVGWMHLYPEGKTMEEVSDTDIMKIVVLRPCTCSTPDEVVPDINTFAEN
jgi:hypothetical protein